MLKCSSSQTYLCLKICTWAFHLNSGTKITSCPFSALNFGYFALLYRYFPVLLWGKRKLLAPSLNCAFFFARWDCPQHTPVFSPSLWMGLLNNNQNNNVGSRQKMCFEIYSLKCCAMVMTNLGNKWYHSLLRTETFSIYCIECLIKALLSERNRIEFKNFFFF